MRKRRTTSVPKPAATVGGAAALSHSAATGPRSGRILSTESPAMAEGLRAQNIELMMQKEALRRTSAEAEDARESLADVFDFAPFCYVTLNADWMVVNSNQAACHFLGYSKTEMIGQRFHRLLDSADACKFSLFCRRLIESRARETCEIRLLRETGSSVAVKLDAIALFNRAEDRRRFLLCLTDLAPRRKAMEDLKESRAQWRALALHLHVVTEAERASIASQVSIELEPVLGKLAYELAEVERQLARPETRRMVANVLSRIQNLRQPIVGALHRMRTMARELRPPALDTLGLVAAVETYATDVQAESHIDCQFNAPKIKLAIAPELAKALFRIFTEAISNIVRYSQATRVFIRLAKEGSSLTLQIADDGSIPFRADATDPRALSLLAMRARIEPFSGKAEITSAFKQGTVLTVSVPQP